MTTRSELEALTRDGLIERARRLGVPRPEVMTRVEMTDEIIRRQETDVAARRRARGWLGVARDLVASLIEQGLNMSDAAELVRQGVTTTRVQHQPPVATVTLAEIYAAQGHLKRALGMLDEVLDKEPDHAAARALRDRISVTRSTSVRPVEPEQPDEALEPSAPAESAAPEAAAAAEPEAAAVAPEAAAAAEPEPAAVAPELAAAAEPEPAAAAEPEAAAAAEPEPEAAAAAEPEPAAAAPPREAPAWRTAPASDVLVLMPGERGVRVFWELSDRSRVLARSLVLRLCAVTPGLPLARKTQRDLPLPEASGSFVVQGLGADAVVRGVLGYERDGTFSPLVVASVVAGDALLYAPPGRELPDDKTLARARSSFAVTPA